ncbi:peptidylprolyl isomerase [Novipirellula artificiosorum]|uniref:Periplasmic chaperone PpiD n=1 Tax=Novipirellula artificiosorum TaxID=2528016 RepID=A0A5C6DVQ9_9BACT|nr:peptidyl-prolyl cis-trans isomerase [Novipirellula artificiosorum]TWU40728.1 peptidylprolyl isomerase [Novipirellula artificiosorum]
MQSPEIFRLVVIGRPFRVLVALIALVLGIRSVNAQIPTRAEIDKAQSIDLPEDPAAVLAVVGQSPIFLGEISPKVQARIDEVLSKAGQEVPEDQLKFARINLTRGMLNQAIQNKMLRESFLLDQVGTQNADKRAEADATLAARARQMFYESELPQLKKQYEVEDLTELDDLLREKGSSLSARQRDFADAMLGHLYIRSKVEQEPTVSLSEIIQHYRNHRDEYEQAAAAKWEQLSVMKANFPSTEAAEIAIKEMGREAYYGGSMQAVAREKSQEPFGRSGGVHDWTTKGSLASEKLDQQIFSLRLNEMSEVITDDEGMHIVRVLERRDAGFTPLSEVQDEIRAKIREQKIAESQKQVMQEMQQRIPVWSLFPEDIPGAEPLPKSISSRQSNRKPSAGRF